MIFRRMPINEALGALLAHGIRAGKASFKKGRVLSEADLAALRAAGIAQVVAARLDAGDVPEDAAATRLATAAAGAGVSRKAAFTGRCNLFAEARGLLLYARERLDRINLLDEAITIAALPPFELVESGQMLATVKIIPFAAPGASLERAAAAAGEDGPLFRLAPLRPHAAGLVMTELPGTKASVLGRTAEVLRQRLAGLGSVVAAEARCAHDAAAVAAAVGAQLAAGASPILVFGASATTDRRDEVPAGIVAAGGRIEHFGMPVDPGNLLLLTYAGSVPVVGLPGCARSPKLNGFDWVLQRLLAGLPVGRQDIMRMGAGGLLMEIASRPQPRAGGGDGARARPARIGAIVLAAGLSRRMGKLNKLVAEIDGQAMVTRAVDAALASQARPVVVVTGHEPERVKTALDGRAVTFAHNADYAEGLSASLRAGLAALPADCDGTVVLLGDMPQVTAQHIDRLIAVFNPLEGRAICVPTCRGKRGNPVLFARQIFAAMGRLKGDVGAKHLIGENAELVAEVPMPDDAIFVDIDTPQALTRFRSGAQLA
ncbi:MAG: 4-diphosphocytidyl-2C-methyl-D-erythritol kinase [Alphaproteobacteria bacterium]|nr:4-diphosphocytidyl-2C-methyl-D-erythritol kinase [Alphaproteobacteria bacterium]